MSCLYCGGSEKLGTEHLIPRARGGLGIPENIFRACRRCNSRKGNRLPSEWRKDLPSKIYDLERRALKLHPNVLPKKQRTKTAIITVCLTKSQRVLLGERAAKEGLGLSTWLLHIGLLTADKRQADRKAAR